MTCQAMMGESFEDIQQWTIEGFLGVEMEAATVFSVSNHFNVPSAAMIMVADNLIENETVIDEIFASQLPIRRKSIELMFEIAIKKLVFG